MSYLNKKHFTDIIDNEIGKDNYKSMNSERLSSNAFMFSSGSSIYIIYINTIIFKLENKKITLNVDKWQTVTSKKWINHGFSLLNTSLNLFQKDFEWFIKEQQNEIKYWDKMELAYK